jgi:hypothetical protein
MSNSVAHIRFTRLLETAVEEVVVEKLTFQALNAQLAKSVVGLIRDTYADQFSDTYNLISRDAVESSYDPDNDEQVSTMRSRIETSLKHGSEYWIVRDFIAADNYLNPKLLALLKVTPKPATYQQLEEEDPTLLTEQANVYINDIMVTPKRNCIGTMLLYSALCHSTHDYQPKGKVLLDSFVGNRAPNAWFTKLGLEPDSTTEVEPFVFRGVKDHNQLQQERYATIANEHNIGYVIHVLRQGMIREGIAHEVVIAA